ncbi:MAG: hypothetical protein NTW28_12475 [Candidatus Solibacter sp.]|nr:hypothetical protein [Candidatus Solibacter sp.]
MRDGEDKERHSGAQHHPTAAAGEERRQPEEPDDEGLVVGQVGAERPAGPVIAEADLLHDGAKNQATDADERQGGQREGAGLLMVDDGQTGARREEEAEEHGQDVR